MSERGGIWVGSLPARNLRRPSNVCARPEMSVPIAAKKVPKILRMKLKMVWMRATTEEIAPEMVSPMDATREGILLGGYG